MVDPSKIHDAALSALSNAGTPTDKQKAFIGGVMQILGQWLVLSGAAKAGMRAQLTKMVPAIDLTKSDSEIGNTIAMEAIDQYPFDFPDWESAKTEAKKIIENVKAESQRFTYDSSLIASIITHLKNSNWPWFVWEIDDGDFQTQAKNAMASNDNNQIIMILVGAHTAVNVEKIQAKVEFPVSIKPDETWQNFIKRYLEAGYEYINIPDVYTNYISPWIDSEMSKWSESDFSWFKEYSRHSPNGAETVIILGDGKMSEMAALFKAGNWDTFAPAMSKLEFMFLEKLKWRTAGKDFEEFVPGVGLPTAERWTNLVDQGMKPIPEDVWNTYKEKQHQYSEIYVEEFYWGNYETDRGRVKVDAVLDRIWKGQWTDFPSEVARNNVSGGLFTYANTGELSDNVLMFTSVAAIGTDDDWQDTIKNHKKEERLESFRKHYRGVIKDRLSDAPLGSDANLCHIRGWPSKLCDNALQPWFKGHFENATADQFITKQEHQAVIVEIYKEFGYTEGDITIPGIVEDVTDIDLPGIPGLQDILNGVKSFIDTKMDFLKVILIAAGIIAAIVVVIIVIVIGFIIYRTIKMQQQISQQALVLASDPGFQAAAAPVAGAAIGGPAGAVAGQQAGQQIQQTGGIDLTQLVDLI